MSRRDREGLRQRGLLVFLFLLLVGTAYGQEQRYSIALRGVPLNEALEYFVDATGAAVAFDPLLVAGRRAYCVVQDEPLEAILHCLLEGTGLDFYRRSSGTYVLALPVALPPQYGYLTGTVIDEETSTPLPDAHVLLADRGLGTVTNQAGQFAFPRLLPGRYAVTVTYLSYRAWADTLTVDAGGHVITQAALQSEPVFITPIIIDGMQQQFGRPGQEAVGRASGLVGLAGRGERDFSQRLQALAGVRLAEVGADVHVQGGEAGEHRFTLDGVPLFLPRHTAGFLGPFSPFAIDRITVHKAGFGVGEGSHLSGVLQAEQVVEAAEGLDVQVDPLSLNARARVTTPSTGGPRITWTTAARTSLYNIHRPAPLRTTLRQWSAPDPFLLLAPLRRYEDIAPDIFSRRYQLSAAPDPGLSYSDLHTAARIHLSPLRTLYVSAYHGRSRLSGDLLGLESKVTSDAAAQRTPLTVLDGYSWINTMAQARFNAVLGGRSLLSVQLRGSDYRLQHAYQFFDNLGFGIEGELSFLDTAQPTVAKDGNRVREWAAVGRLDHVQGRHQLELGVEAAYTDSRFELRLASVELGNLDLNIVENTTAPTTDGGPVMDTTAVFSIRHGLVQNTARAARFAAYSQDRVRLSRTLELEAGLRMTYRPDRSTVYAEPRLALDYEWDAGLLGPGAARLAAGVYRQFINQFDVSTLNAGALLPSTRIWLPLDETVRPPVAYHLSQALLLAPRDGWTVQLEAYLKYLPQGLAINYALPAALFEAGRIEDQGDFLTDTEGHAYGGAVSVERSGPRLRARVLYQTGVAERRSDGLFAGKAQTVPWNAPHQVDLGLDWLPAAGLAFSGRWQGIWGRTWGLRQAYYDYFGHSPLTRFHPPFDLGNPSEDRLPALYQLDLGAAYTYRFGPTTLQLRLELLNALDRHNVSDRRLLFLDGQLRTADRPVLPRMTSLAIRVGW